MYALLHIPKARLAVLMPRVLGFILTVYLIEIIVGGPGQWQIGSLPPVRYLLFLLLIMVYGFDLIVRSPSAADIFAIAWVIALLVGWAVLIPMLNNTPLGNAFSDGKPLLALLVAPITLRLFHGSMFSTNHLLKVLFFASAIVVLLHILFGINVYLNGHRIGQDTAEMFFCLHGQCPGVYVGGMPGGGGRAHWIGSIFLLFFAAEVFFRRDIRWTALLALALYFSWSRSLWIAFLVVLLGMGFVLQRRYPWHLVATVLFVFVAADTASTWRVYDATSQMNGAEWDGGLDKSLLVERNTQGGMNVRIEQMLSHLRVFVSNPLIGTGFGATTDVIRSSTAPWSSESTYTALAYKLGLLGIFVFVLPLILLGRRLRAQSFSLTERQLQFLVVAISFLLMSAFNPYLINAVGMTYIALLYAVIWQGKES
jgi:hypothetical protein